MWGNRLGWTISVGILMLAALLGLRLWQAGQITPATGWVAATVKPIETPKNAQIAVPAMDDPTNAGDFYRSAIVDYQQNAPAYDALESATTLDSAAVADRAGLHDLLQATRCATMSLFRREPTELINFDAAKPALEALEHLGKTAARVGALNLRADDAGTAGWYYAAVYSLGLKLYQERVIYSELTTGEELMGIGCGGLHSLAQRQKLSSIADSLAQLENIRLAQFETNIAPVWEILGNVDPAVVAPHAGDIFQIVKDNTVDDLWRVEAALALGRMRFNADRRADQLFANHLLHQLADDPTEQPTVRAAATAGRDLTIEQYRMIR